MINYVLDDFLGLDTEQAHAIGKLIDRMHKMPRQEFIDAVDGVLNAEQRANQTVEKLLSVLDSASLNELSEELKQHSAVQELAGVITQLHTAGINNVRYDPTLMRGFDYYTGIVFEVSDTHPDNNRSMMGGGRYDGLVGLFGVDPVPTVGFGLGDATLANFLELHKLLPALQPETNLWVALIGDINEQAAPLFARLRSAGLNIAVDISGRKLGDQFKTASKKSLRYCVVIGQSELDSQQYVVKDLIEGSERACSEQELIDQFSSK